MKSNVIQCTMQWYEILSERASVDMAYLWGIQNEICASSSVPYVSTFQAHWKLPNIKG